MEPGRAVLFVNGVFRYPEKVKAMLQASDFLVSVDGGLHHLKTLNLEPHLVIGDLDSISTQEISSLEKDGVRILRFPVAKDETDLELALLAVLMEGYRTIRLVAALGGRLDQTLGNLFLLSRPELASCDVRLEDGLEEVFVVRASDSINGQVGDTVSLLPLGGTVTGVVTRGLEYPLKGETLRFDHTRGISNVMLEQRVEVEVFSGLLLVIHTRQSGER